MQTICLALTHALQWVDVVLDGTGGVPPVLTLVLDLHTLMIGDTGVDQSYISACAKARCVWQWRAALADWRWA